MLDLIANYYNVELARSGLNRFEKTNKVNKFLGVRIEYSNMEKIIVNYGEQGEDLKKLIERRWA